MTRRAPAVQDSTKSSGVHPHHRGFGSRVQHALGRLAPKSWGVGAAAGHHAAPSSPKQQQHPHHRSLGDLELGPRQSATSSNGTDAGPASDGAAGCSSAAGGDASRPQTGSISHISSAGSLAAATNDANSVASGSSSQPGGRGHSSTTTPALQQQQHSGLLGFGTQPDDLCSVATQAGSTAHSFTSLASMVTTTGHGDASSDGCGSLIPAGPAPPPAAASEKAGALSTSPTAAGSSTLSLLSAFRSSDAGGDAASVSTLPLISETGLDEGPSRGYEEGLLEVSTLAEEQEEQQAQRDQHGAGGSSSEGGGGGGGGAADPSLSDSTHPKPRLSSSHGSYTSNTSVELSGSGPGPGQQAASAAAAAAARGSSSPGQGGSRITHGQRSSSRHSFQQQLQQQLLQDLEESQEEGDSGLLLPFSTRRRPDNDDMCSYATQAGSSVHSLSSVISSHMDSTHHQQQQQQQRPHLSSDGNLLPTTGSSRSFSSLQQAAAGRSSRRSSGGQTPAAASPAAQFAGSSHSDAASPVTGYGDCSLPSSPGGGGGARGAGGSSTAAGLSEDGVCAGHGQQGGLQRKGSLKGALKAVSRWSSGISQRLQRTGSGPQPQQQHLHHQHGKKLAQQGGDAAAASGQELAALPRPATQ